MKFSKSTPAVVQYSAFLKSLLHKLKCKHTIVLQTELGIERLLRDGKAGWVMGPSNEVLRQFVGKTVLEGFEVLDYW